MTGFTIGFAIYPNITQLDLTGPFEVLSRLGTPPSITAASPFSEVRVHVAAKSRAPVVSDRGLSIVPDCSFRDAPPFDLICVPGGAGLAEALQDEETVDFIRRQGLQARYVTSVCVGAFLLGAAGLLEGRRATTHWAYLDLLASVGAIPAGDRVVRDGNIITSAGVSAGIDFAFGVVAELAGEDVARAVQLGIEYDPAPPFDSGHPSKAKDDARDLMVKRNEASHEKLRRWLGDRPNRRPSQP